MPINLGKLKITAISALLIITVLILNTSYLILNTSHAETTLERAENDYTFQFSKYRDARDKYLVAKSTFETFKTAVAKGDAFVKTKEYLIQIDNVFTAYLLLVKEQGNYIDWGIEEYRKQEIYNLIDSEISYFQDHPKKIETAQTLEELPALAKEIKDHLENVMTKRINKTLATYEFVETVSTYDKFVELGDKLDVLIQKELQKAPNPFFANWSSEIKTIKDSAIVPLDKAREEFSQIKGDDASEGILKKIAELSKQSKEQILKSKALFEEAIRIL